MIEAFNGYYTFLSNFYAVVVVYEGEYYNSVEHAYQAAKTLDVPARKRIQAILTPGEAKRIGRRVVMRPHWDDLKLLVMEDLLRQKFLDPGLRQALNDTKPQELAEGNWWNDTFWGVCNGVGENNLGKLLMRIRDEPNV